MLIEICTFYGNVFFKTKNEIDLRIRQFKRFTLAEIALNVHEMFIYTFVSSFVSL